MSKNKPQNKKPESQRNEQKVAVAQESRVLAAAESEKKKNRRPKSSYVSTDSKFIGFLARMNTDIVQKYGVPHDPDGNPMVLSSGARGGGLSPAARVARQEKKAEDEAKFAALSDEEKLVFAHDKRVVMKKRREEKRAKAREAMIEQIKAEIKAGTITL